MKETNVKVKGKVNNSEGITLIALVITIIILLIIAGISIMALGGENGLFSRAKQARQNTLDAQNEENKQLSLYEEIINSELGEKEQYTIEYILEDESQSISSQIKIKDEDIMLSSTKPTKIGYNFKGWTTTEGSQEVEYNAGEIYSENKSIKLYPIWEGKSEAQIFVEKAGIEYTFESLDDFVTNSTNEQKGILTSNSDAITYLREHASLIDELKATSNYRLIVPYLLSTDTTVNSTNYNVGLPSYITNGNKLYLGGSWTEYKNSNGSYSTSESSNYVKLSIPGIEGWDYTLATTNTINLSKFKNLKLKGYCSQTTKAGGTCGFGNPIGTSPGHVVSYNFSSSNTEAVVSFDIDNANNKFSLNICTFGNANNIYLYYAYIY